MLTLSPRTTDAANKPSILRTKGLLPMALVSRDKGTLLLQAEGKEVREQLVGKEGASLIEVQVVGEDATRTAIIKGVQRDEVTRRVTHITFQEVSPEDSVKVHVPIVVHGTPRMVARGDSQLLQLVDKLEIRGKMSEIPAVLRIDATRLGVVTSFRLRHLNLPDTLSTVIGAETILVATKILRKGTPIPEGWTDEPTAIGTEA